MSNSLEFVTSICAQLGAKLYDRSLVSTENGCFAALASFGEEDALVTNLRDPALHGESYPGSDVQVCPLTHDTVQTLRRLFPYCAPLPVLSRERTMGVGDRLGIAGSGHIRAFEKFDATPVLAQQSMRELTLTKRTFEQVLDAASCSVFREGFRRGFGADGDHLKQPEEVEYALFCGYTMITLDCSEHIRNDAVSMDDARLEEQSLPYADLYKKYNGVCVEIEGAQLRFGGTKLKRMLVLYSAAIEFAQSIFERYLKGKPVDFEISIDETETPTTPLQHYFVANELRSRGVLFQSMAPRFCGEFQKGIDYIGDLGQFRAEFAVHAAIARHFGYKISLHSGSDKFSVFPIVGALTQERFHAKTSGTSWLEAMRLVAMTSPALYREIHAFALEHFAEARQYYHVATDLSKIPPLESLPDNALPSLFDQNDARQLIHITYGLILSARNGLGERFRPSLFALWRANRESYSELLTRHIGRHLELLGVPKESADDSIR